MKLGAFLQTRGVTLTACALELRSSPETVRRYCLPSADPKARIPHPDFMRRIYVWSAGQVQPNDFYDLPKLRARAA